jgi:hypothetical protein
MVVVVARQKKSARRRLAIFSIVRFALIGSLGVAT